jgi:hypothetical protein
MALRRAALTGRSAAVLAGTPERTLALLRALWPAAVGDEVARKTEVIGLQAGMLRIRVPDATWRRALFRMRRQILERLREVAGSVAPRRLGIDEGFVQPRPPAGPRTRVVRADPPPAEVVAAADAIADPDLRAAFLETAARYLTRAKERSNA